MVRTKGNVVRVVVDGGASFGIEPGRYDLGLTRVEMIDLHLGNLDSPAEPTIVDALLDARLYFARRATDG